MRAPRSAIPLFIVGAACGLVLIAYVWSASIGRLTHGFISYHTAARLLVEGRLGSEVYDDAWFLSEIQRRTASSVLDIFVPNPPTMGLLALPVVAFEPATARTLWLILSVLALAASSFVLAHDAFARRASFVAVAIAVLLISPAVFANLRTAQAYLVLGMCFAGTAIALLRRRDLTAGVFLGLAIMLKMTGVPWLLVLAMARRWRALAAALGTVTLIGLVTLPWTGLDAWLAYPTAVTAFVARPSTGVTAYQTTVGFVRHWCAPEVSPLVAGCQTTATIVSLALLAVATAITALAVRDAPPVLANGIGVCLSLLCVPIAEDHQFVLLAVPFFALLTTTPRWGWVGIALLFLLPPQLTVERFPSGWLSLLAYPRLYATWLLWSLTIGAIWRAREHNLLLSRRKDMA